jgi:hypothetical protein
VIDELLHWGSTRCYKHLLDSQRVARVNVDCWTPTKHIIEKWASCVRTLLSHYWWRACCDRQAVVTPESVLTHTHTYPTHTQTPPPHHPAAPPSPRAPTSNPQPPSPNLKVCVCVYLGECGHRHCHPRSWTQCPRNIHWHRSHDGQTWAWKGPACSEVEWMLSPNNVSSLEYRWATLGQQGTRAPGHQGTRAPGHQGSAEFASYASEYPHPSKTPTEGNAMKNRRSESGAGTGYQEYSGVLGLGRKVTRVGEERKRKKREKGGDKVP